MARKSKEELYRLPGKSPIKFNKETEEQAIILAAYEIIKELNMEGKVTDYELEYIRDKYKIPVEE